MHSKDKLAQELRKAGLNEMASRAETGHYHDFLSPLTMPALQLMEDLEKAEKDGYVGARRLINMHMNGEFDATKEESDAWARSFEGREAMNSLMRNQSPDEGN